MMIKTRYRYRDIKPYITKDGSEIRELVHPDIQGNVRQSLAEAIVPVGGVTLLHKHLQSDEIYHIIHGHGMMSLGDQQFEVMAGDTVYIPSGTTHKIRNQGKEPLKILCCSTPPYSHDDTELAV